MGLVGKVNQEPEAIIMHPNWLSRLAMPPGGAASTGLRCQDLPEARQAPAPSRGSWSDRCDGGVLGRSDGTD